MNYWNHYTVPVEELSRSEKNKGLLSCLCNNLRRSRLRHDIPCCRLKTKATSIGCRKKHDDMPAVVIIIIIIIIIIISASLSIDILAFAFKTFVLASMHDTYKLGREMTTTALSWSTAGNANKCSRVNEVNACMHVNKRDRLCESNGILFSSEGSQSIRFYSGAPSNSVARCGGNYKEV